ncbi:nose resistant to fluoxetine protein 6 [Trichonephila clavipes]|nr:nose resistant to fluoxetine protein 6 [Trichonephila clavipes]
MAIGDYDECLDIAVGKKDQIPKTPEETIFTGKYCLMELNRPDIINKAIAEYESGNTDIPIAKTKTFLNMFVRYKHLTNNTMKIGLCVPSKCSREDIKNIMNSESLRKHIGRVNVPYCEIKGESLVSTHQIVLLIILAIVVCCLILGTIMDAFHRLKTDPQDLKRETPSYFCQIVQKFSLYGNAVTVLSTKRNSDNLSCLCGLRFFVVIMIIYSHTYGYIHKLHFQKYTKAANFIKFFDSFTFSGVGNGSVTLDSLVFVAAVTITYNRWRFVPEGCRVNLDIIKLLIRRYFRLSAAQLLCISLFLLFPLVGSGPFWNAYMSPILQNCHQRWFLNILYISNFWDSEDLCLYHTWILSLLMQLTIIGAVAMGILKRSMRFGIFFMILLILSGVIFVSIMTVLNNLPGGLAFYMLDKRTFPIAWNNVFTKPLDHLGPFCIGLITGYFLALKKDRLKISRIASVILWCSSIVCTTSVMFGLYSYRHGQKIGTPLATFYALMHRNVWCIGIGWMVIACTTHHGGPISRVLKSKTFVPLDRLCYLAYLIHLPIIHYHSATIRSRFFMGHLEILFMAISYISLAFIASFFLNIMFVEPYYAIEKYVTSFFRAKNKVDFQSKTDLNEISIPDGIISPKIAAISNGCVNLGYSKSLESF